jgi:hypothetical protein
LTLESKSVNIHRKSWFRTSQIRTFSVERMREVIGETSLEGLNEIIA